MPLPLIERVRAIADERGVPYSQVAKEFIERGLLEHERRARVRGRAA